MQLQSIPLRVANWVLLGVGLFVLTLSRNPILHALGGGPRFLGIFLIERGYSGALALVVLATLSACSPVEHHTDQQAAMARMTFSPEKCEEVGEVYYKCSGEHALPGASGSAKNDNDASLLRGFCQRASTMNRAAVKKIEHAAPLALVGWCLLKRPGTRRRT